MPKAKASPAPDSDVKPQKTAPKTAQPGKRKPKHGRGELLTGGMPGNKGGTGRPPHAYKVWLEASLSHPAAKGQVTKVLRNNFHPAYASVLGKVMVNVLGIPGRAADAAPEDGPSAVLIDL